jgi:hypothetical protein
MKLKINEFNKDAYEFALEYVTRHSGHAWKSKHALFSFELLKKKYDDEEFDIDLDAFTWEHLMVAERYVNKKGYYELYNAAVDRDSTMAIFYRELGSNNPFKSKSNSKSKIKRQSSRSGGRICRRGGHQRTRRSSTRRRA